MRSTDTCIVHLLLGSNLGDRLTYLSQAIELIISDVGSLQNQSKVYETEPWGSENQHLFLNQLIIAETALSPIELLYTTQKIERKIGRAKKSKWSSRVIDIDILFFENLQIFTSDLIIPHPHISERRFVLKPLDELEPNKVHPTYNMTISSLLAACNDSLNVEVYG